MNRILMFTRSVNWLAVLALAMVVTGIVLAVLSGSLLALAGVLVVGAGTIALLNLTP